MTAAVRLKDVRATRTGLRRLRADRPAGEAAPDAVVLDGVALEVAAGSVLTLLGTSGGGKTTLLRLINRLAEPDAGDVEVQGRPARDWPVQELRRAAVFVGQHPALFGDTVADELARPLRWSGREASEADLRAALETARLDVPLTQSADELSGGERVRLCLARALLLAPKILLLDEPTGSLDVRTARELLAQLTEWARANEATLIVVTHRPEDLQTLGGEAAFLLDGRLHGPFPASDVSDGAVTDPAVRAFLDALPQEPA